MLSKDIISIISVINREGRDNNGEKIYIYKLQLKAPKLPGAYIIKLSVEHNNAAFSEWSTPIEIDVNSH